MEALLDNFLSLLFSPLRVFGIRKCPKCTVRIRVAQMGMIVSAPIRFVPAVRRARARWDFVANPSKKLLVKERLVYTMPVEHVRRVDMMKTALENKKAPK